MDRGRLDGPTKLQPTLRMNPPTGSPDQLPAAHVTVAEVALEGFDELLGGAGAGVVQ